MCSKRSLVLSGGGCNGTLHLGALEVATTLFQCDVFQKRKFPFDRGVAGTSVGSLVGLGVIGGLSPQVMRVACEGILPKLPPVADMLLSLKSTCAAMGNNCLFLAVHTIMRLADIPIDVTFAELFERVPVPFVVCVSNFGTERVEMMSVFSHPELEVARVVVASMSMPLVFPAVELVPGQWFQDGGVMCNLPTRVFPMEQTLALWITVSAQPFKFDPHSLICTIRKTLTMFWAAQDREIREGVQHTHPANVVELRAQLPGFLLVDPGISEAFENGQLMMVRFLTQTIGNPAPLLAFILTEARRSA